MLLFFFLSVLGKLSLQWIKHFKSWRLAHTFKLAFSVTITGCCILPTAFLCYLFKISIKARFYGKLCICFYFFFQL